MVKYNKWDGLLGNNPRKLKRDANKQLKNTTLIYMQKYGRARWIPIFELFEQTIEPTDLFDSKEGKMFFAIQGLKHKINWATNALRTKGYPIINSSFYGKKHSQGYMYADENSDDFISIWKQRANAWEKRVNNLEKEKSKDIELMEAIVQRLLESKRAREAEELKKVIIYLKSRQLR